MKRLCILLAWSIPAAPAWATDASLPPKSAGSQGLFGWSDAGWDTRLELGASGTSGNADGYTLRAALTALHENADGRTKGISSYDHTANDGLVSTNRFISEGTHDFFNVFPKGSRWGMFVNTRYEYNDFSIWDHRLSAFSGVSYRFIKNDTCTLLGRASLFGISMRKGDAPDSDDPFEPAAQAGLDFTWKIDGHQKLEAATTFYPSLADRADFRSITTAAYHLGIDTYRTLKISAEYDHDSTQTHPYRKGDFKWWVSLVFKL